MLSNTQIDTLNTQLGIDVIPGLGKAYPELRASIADIITRELAETSWLPTSWHDSVMITENDNPDDLVTLYAPPTGGPSWLVGDRLAAFQAISKEINNAIGLYAKGQADAGQAQLDALRARADLWSNLYNAAKTIRDTVTDPIGSLFPSLGAGTKIAIVVVVLAVALILVTKTARAIKA